MRRLSKIVATVLILAMLITLMPLKGIHATTRKETSKVTYTLKNGTLTIQGKGDMPKSMMFKKNKEIKKVVIKEGINSIPNYAFKECKNLEKSRFLQQLKNRY